MIITRAMPTQQTAITGVSRRITAGQEIKAELCRGPGRDSKLPGSGVLIWHVDRQGNNRNEQMLPDMHYELSLEQADGLFQMERSASNYGDSNDPFGPQRGDFGESTVPDSNWWDGARSGLDIVKIDAPGQAMTVTTKGIPGPVIVSFGAISGGWRVDRHPRLLAKLAGHGGSNVVDIIGFADDGVWISFNNGDGTFAEATHAIPDFGYEAGGWRVDKHPRLVADLTGDGTADLVGFADAGVVTYLNDGHGSFGGIRPVIANFGYEAGGWRVDRHPRLAADLTGNGGADVLGFGNNGTWMCRNDGHGNFGGLELACEDFGYDNGGWRVDKHPRTVADVTGDGMLDLVGFSDDGVVIALNKGDGTFMPSQPSLRQFGYLSLIHI